MEGRRTKSFRVNERLQTRGGEESSIEMSSRQGYAHDSPLPRGGEQSVEKIPSKGKIGWPIGIEGERSRQGRNEKKVLAWDRLMPRGTF